MRRVRLRPRPVGAGSFFRGFSGLVAGHLHAATVKRTVLDRDLAPTRSPSSELPCLSSAICLAVTFPTTVPKMMTSFASVRSNRGVGTDNQRMVGQVDAPFELTVDRQVLGTANLTLDGDKSTDAGFARLGARDRRRSERFAVCGRWWWLAGPPDVFAIPHGCLLRTNLSAHPRSSVRADRLPELRFFSRFSRAEADGGHG